MTPKIREYEVILHRHGLPDLHARCWGVEAASAWADMFESIREGCTAEVKPVLWPCPIVKEV